MTPTEIKLTKDNSALLAENLRLRTQLSAIKKLLDNTIEAAAVSTATTGAKQVPVAKPVAKPVTMVRNSQGKVMITKGSKIIGRQG